MTLPDRFVFSQSSLQDYVDCPRRFELKYLQRQRWPAPEVDDLLEFERRMEQGERFHHLVHQHLVGIPAPMLLKRIEDATVRGWFETYLKQGLEGVPPKRRPEMLLTVPLGEYALLAKFDLVALSAEKALIMDWKTGQHIPKSDTLARRLQTIVYRYVLAKGGASLNGGVPILPEQIEMVYWYAAHEGATRRFPYDAAQLAADEAYLLQLVEEIHTRAEFPLTERIERCKFCVYRSLNDRGEVAGSLDNWDTDDDNSDMSEFRIDLDQIDEIEF